MVDHKTEGDGAPSECGRTVGCGQCLLHEQWHIADNLGPAVKAANMRLSFVLDVTWIKFVVFLHLFMFILLRAVVAPLYFSFHYCLCSLFYSGFSHSSFVFFFSPCVLAALLPPFFISFWVAQASVFPLPFLYFATFVTSSCTFHIALPRPGDSFTLQQSD